MEDCEELARLLECDPRACRSDCVWLYLEVGVSSDAWLRFDPKPTSLSDFEASVCERYASCALDTSLRTSSYFREQTFWWKFRVSEEMDLEYEDDMESLMKGFVRRNLRTHDGSPPMDVRFVTIHPAVSVVSDEAWFVQAVTVMVLCVLVLFGVFACCCVFRPTFCLGICCPRRTCPGRCARHRGSSRPLKAALFHPSLPHIWSSETPGFRCGKVVKWVMECFNERGGRIPPLRRRLYSTDGSNSFERKTKAFL